MHNNVRKCRRETRQGRHDAASAACVKSKMAFFPRRTVTLRTHAASPAVVLFVAISPRSTPCLDPRLGRLIEGMDLLGRTTYSTRRASSGSISSSPSCWLVGSPSILMLWVAYTISDQNARDKDFARSADAGAIDRAPRGRRSHGQDHDHRILPDAIHRREQSDRSQSRAMSASIGLIRPISPIRASTACLLPTRTVVLSLRCRRFLI